MEASPLSPENALERAMAHELSAVEVYSQAAEVVKGRENKALLRFLAGEETQHMEQLADRISRYRPGDAVPRAGDIKRKYRHAIAREVEESVDRLVRRSKENLPLTWRDVITFAVAQEKQSKSLYQMTMRVVPDPSLRALFEELVKQEKEHIKTLQAIERLLVGRTAIVIAHRLSTIQNADKIIVMHKGEIRETGNHQELLAKKGIYYKLYQLQYKDQEITKSA